MFLNFKFMLVCLLLKQTRARKMAPEVKALAVMPDSLRLILGPVQWKEAVASSELSFDLLVYSHVNIQLIN